MSEFSEKKEKRLLDDAEAYLVQRWEPRLGSARTLEETKGKFKL